MNLHSFDDICRALGSTLFDSEAAQTYLKIYTEWKSTKERKRKHAVEPAILKRRSVTWKAKPDDGPVGAVQTRNTNTAKRSGRLGSDRRVPPVSAIVDHTVVIPGQDSDGAQNGRQTAPDANGERPRLSPQAGHGSGGSVTLRYWAVLQPKLFFLASTISFFPAWLLNACVI